MPVSVSSLALVSVQLNNQNKPQKDHFLAFFSQGLIKVHRCFSALSSHLHTPPPISLLSQPASVTMSWSVSRVF